SSNALFPAEGGRGLLERFPPANGSARLGAIPRVARRMDARFDMSAGSERLTSVHTAAIEPAARALRKPRLYHPTGAGIPRPSGDPLSLSWPASNVLGSGFR